MRPRVRPRGVRRQGHHVVTSVKVRVLDGWAVSYHGGPHRTGGESLDVDAETADQWEAAGWVEHVTKPTTKRRTTKPATSRRRGT